MGIHKPTTIIVSGAVCLAAFSEPVQVNPAEKQRYSCETIQLYPDAPKGYYKGTKLRNLQHLGDGRGVVVYGALEKDSLVLKKDDRTLVRGKDYLVEENWGTLGLAPESSVGPDDDITADYTVSRLRIDSMVQASDGRQYVKEGVSHVTVPIPPALEENETCLYNIFVPYHSDGRDCEIFKLQESPDMAVTKTVGGRIPKTLAKIRSGRPVKIVCWGDSVTTGAEAGEPQLSYTRIFEQMLREKFPVANITVDVVAVGGSSSLHWIYPEQYQHNNPAAQAQCLWTRVADATPDLITIEFVNDANTMNRVLFDKTYGEILKRARALGAEVILIAPHFTNLAMMKLDSLKNTRETRPFVQYLEELSDAEKLGFADASSRWAHLWKEGIPYITLLRNGINHPEARGHRIFAEELIKCFN